MFKKYFISGLSLICILLFTSWGFFAHQYINEIAVFTLPPDMIGFYKQNIQYIREHAVDPDKRRYADSLEAPRHYLDVENYETTIDSIPRKWNDALAKYGKNHLNENGTVPWQIQRTYYNLVNAFKEHDKNSVLHYSAELGHYIGDAHVPLHTTNNHNGQLTNQVGIHGFWESRLPELFYTKYNLMVGSAQYIENPLTEAWKIVTHSHLLVDSVLSFEARLSKSFPEDQKYAYSRRNNIVIKQYSERYSLAYQKALNDMVEKQMRAAILSIGSFWYSAWIDAGQPDLNTLEIKPRLTAEQRKEQQDAKKFNTGKLLGREL